MTPVDQSASYSRTVPRDRSEARQWGELNVKVRMNKLRRLFWLLFLFCCPVAFGEVNFAQLTDPHIFDCKGDVAGNKKMLEWCIERTNLGAPGGQPFDFVVVTGDLGLEGLGGQREKLDSAASELGKIIASSSVKHWLFVPGNNDLTDENPGTIGVYFQFIDALQDKVRNHFIVDLCPRDDDPASGVYKEGQCRFIGFNNASFKSNGKASDAKKFESEQLKDIQQVIDRLSTPGLKHAYLFYHIPEVDDPYYADLLSPDDPEFIKRETEQKELDNPNPKSAWTVTQAVRTKWNEVVNDPRVSARFTGHFHTSLRKRYGGVGNNLFICPPIASKKQEDAPRQARGFLAVSVDCARDEVKSEVVWYEVNKVVPETPAPDKNTGSANREGTIAFNASFLILLAVVVAAIYILWRRAQKLMGSAADSTRRATAVVGLVFLGAVMLGFVVLASLAISAPAGGEADRVVSVGALWALAALAVGSAIGFLFGVPHTVATSSGRDEGGPGQTAADAQIRGAKTNLEEIADWLSKLIIGGTVFQSGNVVRWLGDAGTEFARTVGAETDLWRGVGSSSLVYFGLVGLFGGHFMTRLYLIGALRRADEGDRPVVAERAGLTVAQLAALDAAPLNIETAGAEFDPIAREAADKIVELPLDSLTNWRDVRLWSKAQLSKGNVDAAIRGYQKAIEAVPNDAETRLGYAVSLAVRKSAKHIILTQLEAARASVMLNTPKDLRKNVYKSLTYVCLDLKKPEGFSSAIRYAREYLERADAIQSGGLWINIACAYGQAYSWLAEDDGRKVLPQDVTVTSGPSAELLADSRRDDLLKWISNQALNAMKNAIARDDGAKTTFRELMGIDPRPPERADDNDLECFGGDDEFRRLVTSEKGSSQTSGST
ncbi:MAG TPA: metallophosphoesterase [Chthoniobacter sp.]|jgi:tetratricopeptide (TPR) repeat protein